MKMIALQILDFIKKYWKLILIAIFAIVIVSQCGRIRSLNEENARIEKNYYAMCDTATVYKTAGDNYITKTKNLELTVDELNALYDDALGDIKELNIKIKNLEAYQHGIIEKTIHDTVTLTDTIIDSTFVKKGVWTDGCMDMTFEIGTNKMYFNVTSRDIIDIYITEEKIGKWYQFWKWPRETQYQTTTKSLCPNTKVVVNTCKITK